MKPTLGVPRYQRLLEPFVLATPLIDDVGKCFWAACNLSEYYRRGGDHQLASAYAQEALNLVQNAAEKTSMSLNTGVGRRSTAWRSSGSRMPRKTLAT